jgi:hypothetical protein
MNWDNRHDELRRIHCIALLLSQCRVHKQRVPGDEGRLIGAAGGTLNKVEFPQAMGLIGDLTVGGMTFEPGLMRVEGDRLAMSRAARS